MRYYSRLETSSVIQLNIFLLKETRVFENSGKTLRLAWGNRLEMGVFVFLPFHNEMGANEENQGYLGLGSNPDCNSCDVRVIITSTRCNFGGFRYWFLCPECGKRVGILYFRGGLFNCRECSYLTYESRNVGGRQKDFGRIISVNEVKYFREQAKRKYYNGKLTRKYIRFRKKEWKARWAWGGGVLSSAGLI